MMIKGIVRRVDGLGRIVIPVETRRMLGLKEDPYVDMYLDGQIIRIKLAVLVETKGIVRRLDNLGRVTVPREYRKLLHVAEGDEVDMYLEGNEVCIQKAVYGCGWCGSSKELYEVNGHHICKACAYDVVDTVVREKEKESGRL